VYTFCALVVRHRHAHTDAEFVSLVVCDGGSAS
jgi:hypothetical protein